MMRALMIKALFQFVIGKRKFYIRAKALLFQGLKRNFISKMANARLRVMPLATIRGQA